MDDLLKKLNVLVKSTISDALTGDSRRSKLTSGGADNPSAVQEGTQQIAQLRQRIDETLAFEDELQKRIQALQAQVDDWDGQADSAVQDGDDAKARYAVGQMQLVQKQLTMAQSDLVEHERVSQELIYHVNTLEAAVEAAKQETSTEVKPQDVGESVSNVLREMREKVLELRDQVASRGEISAKPEDNTTEVVSDDLEKRRRRLAKPE